ncbi:hypothetical protein [uncultured Halomonas sp.]|uniref:hypothetical protein n=1 Tax=uncultured Halomonas sp. TaxID=173971 RepID=UPI00262E54EE|nr:hypothetical protein [uncultured Halomonas sp.]
MGDTTHDDDRPSLAAKDRGRRVPTRAELDELEAMFRELEEQYPADRVSDFEVTFGMTADHMREHYPDAYRDAAAWGMNEVAPADDSEGTSDAPPGPRGR